MKLKHMLIAFAGAFSLILTGCEAGGSAHGSGTTTTTHQGHSTMTSGSGQVSGSGFINRN